MEDDDVGRGFILMNELCRYSQTDSYQNPLVLHIIIDSFVTYLRMNKLSSYPSSVCLPLSRIKIRYLPWI